MTQAEQEVSGYLLSDTHFKELIRAYGEKDATRYIALLRNDKRLLTYAARETIAFQVQLVGSISQKLTLNDSVATDITESPRSTTSLNDLFIEFETAHARIEDRKNEDECCLDALVHPWGFRPYPDPWEKVTCARGKIRAILDALDYFHLLRHDKKPSFILIGKRYGFNFDQLPEIKKGNSTHRLVYNTACETLRTWKTRGLLTSS